MATITSSPTISASTGIDTISSTTGVDTIANFFFGTNLSIKSVYLPFARDQTTDTPYSLFKTIDADGSVTNYHGDFVRSSATSPIATGSKITSFNGMSATGVEQFYFSTSKSYDGVNLKTAVQANDKVTFFNIVLGGNDSLSGSSYDDVLGGYAGNDTIDGSLGKDKVFFSGKYADYKITPTESYVTVENTKTGETDTVTNVELLQFTDTTIATPMFSHPVGTLPIVSVAAKQSSVTEGGNLVYTVSLDKAATSDLTIPYTLNGKATSADYTGGTQSVTILKGSTSVDISLLTKDDGITEQGGETVILTLGAITTATIATPSASATINDKIISPTVGNNITLTAPAALLSNTSKVNASNVTTAGDDKITSTIANLAGANGYSSIDGGAGNDTLIISDVADALTMIGGFTGNTKNVEVLQLANGNNLIGITQIDSITTVKGGTGDDFIVDLKPNSLVESGAGNDTIYFLGNDITVNGGSGKDIFFISPAVSSAISAYMSKATLTDFVSGTDKLSLAGISTTTSTPLNSSIIGSWKATTSLGDAIATFMADGTYFYADPQGGAERGTYSWDSTKNTFSVTGNTFDTSSLGFYPSSTPTAVTFDGTSASWTVQGVKVTANPITDSAKQIVGSWYANGLGKAGGDSVFTFLSDGTYYIVNNGDPALDSSGKKGMEKGTYTWNANTGSFSISSTTVNNDGQWGFSDIGSTPLTATVVENTLSFSGIGTLTKVTTSPTILLPVFEGNKANFAQAQAAITANTNSLQVVFEQDTKTLWADVNNDGILNSSDLQITLNGVNTLSATDFIDYADFA